MRYARSEVSDEFDHPADSTSITDQCELQASLRQFLHQSDIWLSVALEEDEWDGEEEAEMDCWLTLVLLLVNVVLLAICRHCPSVCLCHMQLACRLH